MTNWLHACSHDRECRGEAVCLNAVCSVSCATHGADRCVALGEHALCDMGSRACDLTCNTSRECVELGAGFTCREGRCRESDGQDTGSGDTALAPTGAITSAAESGPFYSAGEAEWIADTISDGGRSTFDPGVNFKLGAPTNVYANPMASWQGDHWNVAWALDRNTVGDSQQFEVTEVYLDGRLHSTRVATASLHWNVERHVKGYDGIVAHVGSDLDAQTCAISASNLVTGMSNSASRLQCLDGLNVTPIPESDEWLIAWTSHGDPARDSAGLTLVRYDARRVSFGEPWWFADGAPDSHSAGLATLDGDVWMWSSNSSGCDLYRLNGLARPTLSPSFAPKLTKVATLERAIRQIVAVPDGVVVFEQQGESGRELRTFAIRDDLVGKPTPIASPVYEAAAAHLPERHQIAVCIVGDGVKVVILDEGGVPTQPLVLLEEKANASTCDLAWSGSELLVVWGTGRTFIAPPDGGPINTPVEAPVSARIVPLSVVLL